MALSQSEKDLLAVVKYYNDNKKAIGKLIVKLGRDFDLISVSHLTGLDVNEIGDILNANSKPKRQSKQKAEPIEPDPVIETVSIRKPIELNSESNLAERLAHEMSMTIGAKFQSGDKFYSRKEAMKEFEAGQATVAAATQILVDHNYIEMLDGDFRKGYVVK